MGNYITVFKKGLMILTIIIAFIIITKLFIFYIPFLIAYIISLIVDPLIKWVAKKTNLSRKVSSIIVLATIFLIVTSIVILGIVSLISETTNLISGLNTYLEKSIQMITGLADKIDLDRLNLSGEINRIIGDTATNFVSNITDFIKNILSKFLSYITSIPTILIYTAITILATYFITSDKFYILDRMEHHVPKKMLGKIITNVRSITASLSEFIKAQFIIIGISFIIVLIGLNIFYIVGMNIEYPILIAISIGFVDALPILGSGTIMIPWSIISFLNKNYGLGFAILGLYILVIVVRQLLEPKIVSVKIGIHPIFTLIAMYTGFKIIGVMGLLIGPVVLIILKSVFANSIDKGIIKAIVE